jgi:hypothetical protein
MIMSVNIIEKNGKRYIDDEEILIEYEFISYGLIIFRFFCISTAIYVLSVFYTKTEVFSLTWFLLMFIVLIIIYTSIKEIINFYHSGFYITKNNFITFKGYKVNKNELHFEKIRGEIFWGINLINFYKNDSFVFQGLASSYDGEFKILLDVIYEISNNEDFKFNPVTSSNSFYLLNRNTKYKLIKKEEY